MCKSFLCRMECLVTESLQLYVCFPQFLFHQMLLGILVLLRSYLLNVKEPDSGPVGGVIGEVLVVGSGLDSRRIMLDT